MENFTCYDVESVLLPLSYIDTLSACTSCKLFNAVGYHDNLWIKKAKYVYNIDIQDIHVNVSSKEKYKWIQDIVVYNYVCKCKTEYDNCILVKIIHGSNKNIFSLLHKIAWIISDSHSSEALIKFLEYILNTCDGDIGYELLCSSYGYVLTPNQIYSMLSNIREDMVRDVTHYADWLEERYYKYELYNET
jgi:hypothetical protein